jgi:tRNA threonylcarbamoyladenosine biosynthesis protein TsaB
MQVILSLETSTDVCSVALHDGTKLLSEAVLHQSQAHASQLAPLINRVMRESHSKLKDVQAIAISSGPGSYTGLRIGTSTAKGLCYGLEIPLIAVGTLELLAYQGSAINKQGALLCPMIDARRMEVYCLVADAGQRIMEEASARMIDENSFAELLKEQQVLFFGSGSEKCMEVIRHPHALFESGIVPLASALGEMAAVKYSEGQFEDLVHFKPFYLKEFVAKKAGARP